MILSHYRAARKKTFVEVDVTKKKQKAKVFNNSLRRLRDKDNTQHGKEKEDGSNTESGRRR